MLLGLDIRVFLRKLVDFSIALVVPLLPEVDGISVKLTIHSGLIKLANLFFMLNKLNKDYILTNCIGLLKMVSYPYFIRA